MSIIPVLFSSALFFLFWIAIVVLIISRFLRFQKETKSRPAYQTVKQNPKLQPKKQQTKSAPVADPLSNKPEKPTVFSKPQTSPFGKEPKKKRSFFGRRESDCDLDERIFGPRNQNKDIF